MFLLEGYVYWPDMVLIGLALWSAIAITMAVVILSRRGSLPAPNDDEKLRQEIYDGLVKMKKDIESTVQ